MQGLLRWFKSKATMKIEDSLFTDKVNGMTVYRYVDCYGKRWMAQDK